MPKIAASIGVFLTTALVLFIFACMVWAIKNQRKIASLCLTSVVLVLIGYSTYALIFIRSNQDPGIDENDPETVEAFISYLEREQYGDVGLLPRRFKGIPPIHEVVGFPEGPGRGFHHPKKETIAGIRWAGSGISSGITKFEKCITDTFCGNLLVGAPHQIQV